MNYFQKYKAVEYLYFVPISIYILLCFINSNITGVRGFYFELARLLSLVCNISIILIIISFRPACNKRVKYKKTNKKDLRGKIVILPLQFIITCLMCIWLYYSIIPLVPYLKDISYVKNNSFSKECGYIEDIQKGKNIVGAKLYIHGIKYNYTNYHLDEYSVGDRIQFSYCPFSKHIINLEKYP